MKLYVPRGMIYLYDYDVRALEIPEYNPSNFLSVSRNAASLAVQTEEDGEVEMEVLPLSEFNPQKSANIFAGEILVENPFLTICLLGEERVAGIRSSLKKCKFIVAANFIPFPSKISIYVQQSTKHI